MGEAIGLVVVTRAGGGTEQRFAGIGIGTGWAGVEVGEGIGTTTDDLDIGGVGDVHGVGVANGREPHGTRIEFGKVIAQARQRDAVAATVAGVVDYFHRGIDVVVDAVERNLVRRTGGEREGVGAGGCPPRSGCSLAE